MKQTRLTIARQDIFRYFDGLPKKLFRQKDIASRLAAQRAYWRLAQSTSVEMFIRCLLDSKRLTQTIFPFPKPYKREVRYVWGDASSAISIAFPPLSTNRCTRRSSENSARMASFLTSRVPSISSKQFAFFSLRHRREARPRALQMTRAAV